MNGSKSALAVRLVIAALLASSPAPAQQRVSIPIEKDRTPVDTLHTYQPGIDVLRYDFSIYLTGDSIAGSALLTVRRFPGVRSLRLDLMSAMKVEVVNLDDAEVEFTRDGDLLTIPIATAALDSFSVLVRYHGTPADGLIIRTDSAGRRTVFGDNWPNRARHWLPTVDHPSDKALVRWTVFVTDDRTVVANGRPAGTVAPSAELPNFRGFVWQEDRPIPTYLMVIGVARMVETSLGRTACGFSDFSDCVPQSVFTFPEQADYIPGPFAKAAGIVTFFSRMVGIFPYERLAHVQSSTRFGGMENATAIFYSDAAFKRRAVRTGLIAHESAHQWFGDAVTPREWAHVWLSEGFATYFEQLWAENDFGSDSLRAGMVRIRNQIVAAKEVATRPVIDTAQKDLMELLNTNSYQKGGFVLHMLRTFVGDSAFFRGVRTYYAQHRHGTALTRDLQRHMERAGGRDLGWFFNQWLRRPGFATVAARWVYDPATRKIAFKAVQSGRHGFYRLTLPIEIDDGVSIRRVLLDIPPQAETRLFVPIDLPNAPRRITVDPDAQVLAVITTMGL